MCLYQKKKGKSIVLSRGFRLFDLETKQKASKFWHIYYLNVRSHSSAPESNKQNPQDITLDLPIYLRYKHTASLKDVPSPARNESLPYWFSGQLRGFFSFGFMFERISFVCIR